MKEILSPSLLPYLQADANQIRLEISLISRESSFLEKSPYPFLLIDESTPFERLLEAKIVTGVGSELRRVFLLQQADSYRHAADGLWPLTNMDIDQRWKTAFDLFSSQNKTDRPGPIWLSDPVRDSVGYLPFQPLFYCSFKNVYFHPPCPECGGSLDLCRNDQLLTEAGLLPYSTSLRRYLFCPGCHQDSKVIQFYTHSRRGDDPVNLKDRWDLINDFGNLILKSDSSTEFPCSKCPELSACYGGDNRVIARIVPFSFYPFHMLLFEAHTLSASDFLALVSGATVEALKANMPGEKTGGRQHCLHRYEQQQDSRAGLLFGGENEKSFLEILYLKLSFLGELIGMFYADSTQGVYCDASMSLDRIWVRLTDQAGRLPQFWNFTLTAIDLWSYSLRRPRLSKFPPAYGHHFLANIWFYTLLVNAGQSLQTVHAELEKMMPAPGDPAEEGAEITATGIAETVFAPENIYWNPESKQVPENWLAMWNRALEMGKAMLTAGFGAEPKWSPDEFWPQFDRLRSDIRAALFGPVSATAEIPAENQAIANILMRLLDKWRRELAPPKIPEAVEDADTVKLGGLQPTEDTVETLILPQSATPVDALSADRRPDEEETLILSSDNGRQPSKSESEIESTGEERLQATVILSPQDRLKQPKTGGESADEEPLQETVILSPKSRPMQPKPDVKPSDEELIQETVILSPGNSASKPAGGDALNSNLSKADLSETIVLSPGEGSDGLVEDDAQFTGSDRQTAAPHHSEGSDTPLRLDPKKSKYPPQDDDILTETVILRPKDYKGSKDE